MNIDSVSAGSAKVTGKTNPSLRKVVSTGDYSELVAITLPPGGEIGEEAHDSDQAVFIVEGRGEAILHGRAEPSWRA